MGGTRNSAWHPRGNCYFQDVNRRSFISKCVGAVVAASIVCGFTIEEVPKVEEPPHTLTMDILDKAYASLIEFASETVDGHFTILSV